MASRPLTYSPISTRSADRRSVRQTDLIARRADATGFVERFAAMGAPWTFGFHDLPALAGEAGLAIADATNVGELHRFYWPDRPVESIIYDHYFLCTLTSPPA